MALRPVAPQNTTMFETSPGGGIRMHRAWILFFQQLQTLISNSLETIPSGTVDNFVTIASDGQLSDSGYDALSFAPAGDDGTTSVLTALTGGAPNLQAKTRSLAFVRGGLDTFGAESSSVAVKPKAYLDIDLGLQASPTGASAPGLVNWNSTGIFAYGFDGLATSEQLFGNCEYNHQFKEGADIYPHIHWAPTTNGVGDVKWNLTLVWDNMGEGPSTAITVSVTQAASGTAWRPQKVEFPTVSGASKKIGSQIQFRLWRDPGDAADTYAADAVIQTFGFHAEVDSFGSTGVTTK